MNMILPRFILVLSLLFTSGNFVALAVQLQQNSQITTVSVNEYTTDATRLRYRGYLIRKRVRQVPIADATEENRPYFARDEFATLSLKSRTLLRFDGVYAPMGNALTLGLFSFLGDHRKQLFVSQDTFRGGNQWVVSLRRSPQVVYDGKRWLTGREVDDMAVLDLDGDGISEISVPTCIFYGFEQLSPAATPLPTIIFKYSKKAGRYLPANPDFESYLRVNIQGQKRTIPQPGGVEENMNHLSATLSVVLDYIFVSREKEAWTFFDQTYKLPGKKHMKKKIMAVLSESPVYRFIHSKYRITR